MNLSISNKPIEQDRYLKYFYLIIDANLSWKIHVHELPSKKLSKGIGVLSRVRFLVDSNVILQLYYSLIYPFLIHGPLVWGNTYCTTLKLLTISPKWWKCCLGEGKRPYTS